MNYEKVYINSKNAWGTEPNKLLEMIISDIPAKAEILDLDSAQGKDALYLASLGHRVTAVEISEAGNTDLEKAKTDGGIRNITPIRENIRNFTIEKNKYDLINLQNVLQFIPPPESIALIEAVKESLRPGGFVVIAAFTKDDPSFRESESKIKFHFAPQELLRLFSDFRVIYYFEKKIPDKGHASKPEPHNHGVAKIIAKKLLINELL